MLLVTEYFISIFEVTTGNVLLNPLNFAVFNGIFFSDWWQNIIALMCLKALSKNTVDDDVCDLLVWCISSITLAMCCCRLCESLRITVVNALLPRLCCLQASTVCCKR